MTLPDLTVKEQVTWDYRLKSLNEWGVHPVDLMRRQLLSLGATPMARLPPRGFVTTAGVVVSRQKPPTAGGVAFYVVEDGPLRIQVVISPALWERSRSLLRDARVLIVSGDLEKRGRAWTLRAERLADLPPRVGSKNLEFVITAVTIQGSVGGSLELGWLWHTARSVGSTHAHDHRRRLEARRAAPALPRLRLG